MGERLTTGEICNRQHVLAGIVSFDDLLDMVSRQMTPLMGAIEKEGTRERAMRM